MSHRFSLLRILAMLMLAAPLPMGAHVRITTSSGTTPEWNQMPIRYRINEDGSAQIPNDSEFLAVHAALNTWAGVEGAHIRFQYGGPTASRDVGLDGVNLITFGEEAGLLGSTTLAATFSFFTSDRQSFLESDIAFNPAFRLTTSGEPEAFDIQGVLTHEAGHLLGLDHTGIVSSVMSPFARRNQTDQRVLQYDDAAGVRAIYPAEVETPTGLGTISGSVHADSGPVPGAHVVAMDADGTPLVSTLSERDGTYRLGLLPPGDYRVYAEPLDGPVSEENVSNYFQPATDFQTTFATAASSPSEALVIQVIADATSAGNDIQVRPPGLSGFNLTAPSFAPRVARGTTGSLTVGGEHVEAGIRFSSSTPALMLGTPSFGGRVSSAAPTSAKMSVSVATTAPLGPKIVIGASPDDVSLVSGTIVITDPAPSLLTISPATGPFEGGTIVQIQGVGFRPGVGVHFGGLPGVDVERLNSGLLQVTTPENVPGPANVQVFNSDGTAATLAAGFQYTAPPPAVSSVQPSNGPPGTFVVIEGRDFDTRRHNVVVRFNGQPARIVETSRTRIETVVPFGATTGPLTVTVFGVEASGGMFTVDAVVPGSNPAPEGIESIQASSAAGGNKLSFPNSDDGIAFLDLPFAFSLFTDTFLAGERMSIATNGWISLDGASNPEFQNTSLPAETSERPSGSRGSVAAAMIAPFFDDVILSGSAEVSTRVIGTSPRRKFVVQWSGASLLDEVGNDLEADLTFQLILYEGSNDVRFIYRRMIGPRSDGSSATVGMQNLARNTAIQSGFNRSFIATGDAITYRFENGSYSEEINDTRLAAPEVRDGGSLTWSQTELIASWSTPQSSGSVFAYDYAIGTTPGGTDVRDFQSVAANSVVVTGLSLREGATYYFAVRGRAADGGVGAVGVSDGIQVDPSFQPTRFVFPDVFQSGDVFGGIALMGEMSTDVVLRAVSPDGTLPMGLGIQNPTTVRIEGGRQFSQLVVELFGLSAFDGWVEMEASEPSLKPYVTQGALDLSFLDGSVASPTLTDFTLVHAGATALLVNPNDEAVEVTLVGLDTSISTAVVIPPRARHALSLTGGPARVTASEGIAASEHIEGPGNLALGPPAVRVPSSRIVLPHAVVGEGYRSWVTLTNHAGSRRRFEVEFSGVERIVDVEARQSIRFSLAALLDIADSQLRAGAVRIRSLTLFGDPSLSAVIDIERDDSRVTFAASPASSEIVFPHVADVGGFFTGIAIAAGESGATIRIEVFTPSGELSGSATVTLGADEEIARLVRELVPGFPGQNGGYIRLDSDHPIWAWQIYGTAEAMASGPPL